MDVPEWIKKHRAGEPLTVDDLADAIESIFDAFDAIIERLDQEKAHMELQDEDTYTITGGPLKPHEYIMVRREMTAADKAWIQNHGATMGGNAKNPKMQLTLGDIDLALLKRMIVGWHRTREDKESGKQVPVPLTEQNIEKMSDRLSTFVKNVINALNPDTEEEDNAFLPGAGGSSGENSKTTSTPLPNP